MNWRENWIDWLLKALLGGSAAAALDQILRGGQFLGWLVFVGLSTRLRVELIDGHHLRAAYPHWAGEVLPQAVSTALDREGQLPLGVSILLVTAAALLLLLLAHVVFKGQVVQTDGDGASPPRLRDCLKELFGRRVAVGERCRGLAQAYRKLHFVLTWVAFAIAAAVLIAVDELALWMVVVFVLLALPGFLYLILYPRDLFGGQFREQFGYLFVLVLLFFGILSLPFLYGRRFFDVQLPVANTAIVDGAVRELRVGGAETMVFDQEATILGTLRQKEDKFVVELWPAESAEYDGLDTRSLRDLGRDFVLSEMPSEEEAERVRRSIENLWEDFR